MGVLAALTAAYFALVFGIILGAALQSGTGFTDNLVHAIEHYQTLIAGTLAFLGALLVVVMLNRQIALTRNVAEVPRNDVVERRLADLATAMMRCVRWFRLLPVAAGDAKFGDSAERLRSALRDPAVLGALGDPAMGKDQRLIALFVNCIDTTLAKREGSPVDADGRLEQLVEPLYDDITASIHARRKRLQQGVRWIELSDLGFVNAVKYERAWKTGTVPAE